MHPSTIWKEAISTFLSRKEIYYLVLGHLQKGSVAVKEGELIEKGQFLGLVGNSGLTPRSHIHMQVSQCNDGNYWNAMGVPFQFDNEFIPIKNKVTTI